MIKKTLKPIVNDSLAQFHTLLMRNRSSLSPEIVNIVRCGPKKCTNLFFK